MKPIVIGVLPQDFICARMLENARWLTIENLYAGAIAKATEFLILA